MERKKILPLTLMFFCMLFNYTILRDTKDVLVVTAPQSGAYARVLCVYGFPHAHASTAANGAPPTSTQPRPPFPGAEVIPFLKTYVNLPAALLITIVYSKLCNVMPMSKVFYTLVTPFLAFFAAFAFAIYPNREFLHPNALADHLQTVLPSSFKALISIFRNWTYALFYTMAELWGSVVVSLLFWGFANEVTTVPEAKKYYPLFGLGANVALIFSGQYVRFVSSIRKGLPEGVDKWGVSLKLLMGAVVALGSVMVGAYTHMQRNVLTDPECYSPEKQKKASKKSATSMSLGESAQYLFKSKYIRDLATLVIAYGALAVFYRVWRGLVADRWVRYGLVARLSASTHPIHHHPPFPRHVDQHRGGDVEGQAQGGLPGPQRLLLLHGQLLHRHRVRPIYKLTYYLARPVISASRQTKNQIVDTRRTRPPPNLSCHLHPQTPTHTPANKQRRDAGDDAPGPVHLPEVRLGRGGAHHARHAARHGRRLLLAHYLQRSVLPCLTNE